ncbi:DUF4232 domain-containing protein [Streptomyces sp. NBC_00102]|uniref:DUF4232 domain-containing protein n=1 Tax=Streptomyces sp. NBC_00102 TaxID=2975652 RepID=UPI002255CB72|nr:DUF4232 domain-containing protein [Streptomyces sp. NBC_00102]MCX5401620.1 DUF4232 domain-containing protein [Streptomyces sp. NBC_00102]
MNSNTFRAGSVRRGLRGALAGAAVAAALLTATACHSSDGDDAAAAPSGGKPSGASASKSDGPSGDSGTGTSATPTEGDGGATAEPAGDSGETGGDNGTYYQDCKADGLTTAVELQDAPGETPRHFMLTVTNGGRVPCVLNEGPLIRLGSGSDAPTVQGLVEPDSEPLVVAGGGKAYAGLYVFGNDEGGEAEYDQSDRFTATLVAGEGTELSGVLLFDLPGGLRSVSYDDAARVNGWAGTEGLAMRAINQL